MDADDWRNQLQHDSRRRIVNRIVDALKRHYPFSGREAFRDLTKLAAKFERKCWSTSCGIKHEMLISCEIKS
ncbi:hypothetical protein ACOSQ4_021533 [Xanthoceras sorbifolium]